MATTVLYGLEHVVEHKGRYAYGQSGNAVEIDPHGDFSVGRWLWLLTDVERVDPPIPARGYQKVWTWGGAWKLERQSHRRAEL